jgi:hypothetical protein
MHAHITTTASTTCQAIEALPKLKGHTDAITSIAFIDDMGTVKSVITLTKP